MGNRRVVYLRCPQQWVLRRLILKGRRLLRAKFGYHVVRSVHTAGGEWRMSVSALFATGSGTMVAEVVAAGVHAFGACVVISQRQRLRLKGNMHGGCIPLASHR